MHLLLLDSASLYWRAFHALPDSVVGPDGSPINAVRGFLDTVARMIENRTPDRVIACWDNDWRPLWRVELVPSYKAHRVDGGATVENLEAVALDDDEEQIPDLLSPQIPLIAQMANLLGIEVLGAPHYEADDVIATLALRANRRGDSVDIASGDRDLVQLVDERTSLLYTGGTSKSRGGKPWVVFDPPEVHTRFGIPPQSYALMAVLRGDPSDGLPGVRGIGQKTAVTLVNAFPRLDTLLNAASDGPIPPLTPRTAQAIVESADMLTASYAITALVERDDIPEISPEVSIDRDAALSLASRIGVERSVDRILHTRG